jgi:diguanylate cyclase (GGDEF)-like protein
MVGIVFYFLSHQFDFFERLAEATKNNEDSQLDEFVLALTVTGTLGFLYGFLRLYDLSREIRRRDSAEQRARWNAGHDTLTRLPNRQGLMLDVAAIRARGVQGAPWVAYSIDIDNFQEVNELHGQEIGDAILIEVADRLRSLFEDTLYRLDGDEFFAAERRLEGFDYLKTANRIARLIERPISVGGLTLEIGVTIGLARYPEDAANIELLMRCAKTALRAAKKAGTGEPRWFDASLDQAVVRRAQLDKDLRAAIRDGQIRPYYQPQIDLTTGEIEGFEALARWKRSDGSFVSPVEFIPLAEETGLINELFDNLFRQACQDARAWPPAIGLAFNVSPAQLSDRELGVKIMRTLAETGLSPKRLEVEITESALVEDLALASTVMADLQKLGVTVALDDFGTGYSSLSQLAKLKFDKLKIDRSFVATFQDDDRQAKIVRAMLGLGRGLGMTTIAEGIEEPEQAETLRLLGCHHGQGFLYGRAVPLEETVNLVREKRRAS